MLGNHCRGYFSFSSQALSGCSLKHRPCSHRQLFAFYNYVELLPRTNRLFPVVKHVSPRTPSGMALLRQLTTHIIGSECGLAAPGYFIGNFQRRIDDASDATNLLFKFRKAHLLIEPVVGLNSSSPCHFQQLHHPLLQRNEATKIDTKSIRTPLLKTLDHLCVGNTSNVCRDGAP